MNVQFKFIVVPNMPNARCTTPESYISLMKKILGILIINI